LKGNLLTRRKFLDKGIKIGGRREVVKAIILKNIYHLI